MSKPLGKAVGNSLEVIEAIEALKGNSHADLHEISVELSAQALCMAGKGSEEECRVMAKEAISSGRALKALEKMIELQGGDPAITGNYGLFKKAERTAGVYAAEDGYVECISCEEAGIVSLLLGAGRKTKESGVDYTAGIVFDKTAGDKVNKGDRLAALYTSTDCDLNKIAGDAFGLFKINKKLTKNTQKNIIKIIKGY
jgi:pyrimidine-nucleoside phosphorylase